MWRSIALMIAPVSVLAQAVPLSLLVVEENTERQVLQLRNNYDAAVVCFVLGYNSGLRNRRTVRWDLSLGAVGEPLAPGAVRDFNSNAPLEAKLWEPLAVIYADGAYAGSDELIQSLMEDHQIVSQEIEKAIDILTVNADAQAAIQTWFDDIRNPHARPGRPYPSAWVAGRIGPIMAEISVPRYVRQQLQQGKSQAQIIEALRTWQTRLEQYNLHVAFV